MEKFQKKSKPLPLLQYLEDIFKGESFENTYVIGAQHILETTLSMFESLSRFGLDPKKVFLIGKCYSSSFLVKSMMEDFGLHVSSDSFFYDPRKPFDDYYQSLIKKHLKESLKNIGDLKGKRLIIIDDGGMLLKESLSHPGILDNVVGIEQTSSGYEKIKDLDFSFPVVNVARSFAKTEFESPMIANKVIRKLYESDAFKQDKIDRILILGNGFIGSRIKQQIGGSISIDVFDSDPEVSDMPYLELQENLPEYDMVIGSTGKHSFPYAWISKLKYGATLVSVSSSDREFCAADLRIKKHQKYFCHSDIEVDGVRLLNSGFPVNFDGSNHSVCPALIQFTRALLMTAIIQSNHLRKCDKGLVELDEEFQRMIIQKFMSIEPEYFEIFNLVHDDTPDYASCLSK